MTRPFRGSAVRLTLPYVFKFLGLWIAVTILIVVVFSVTSYMLLSNRVLAPDQRQLAIGILGAQMFGAFLAIAILAVFTTHRLAGPLLALRKAFEDVKGGDLSRRLRFRRSDNHLRDLEAAFNEMMENLESQSEAGSRQSQAR